MLATSVFATCRVRLAPACCCALVGLFLRRCSLYAASAAALVALLLAGLGSRADAHLSPRAATAAAREDRVGAGAALPLTFIANRGQVAAEVRYYLGGSSHSIFFTDRGLVLRQATVASPVRPVRGQLAPGAGIEAAREVAFRLDFLGGNDVVPVGRETLPGRVHYLVGRDPRAWYRDIPTVRQVVYPSLWGSGITEKASVRSEAGGVDLIYELDADSLKYRLVVHPGSDAGMIKLAYSGIEDLAIDVDGNLRVRTPVGELSDAAPVAYQDIGDARVTVPVRFELLSVDRAARRFVYGFTVGAFDPRSPLVIDPGLEWATLLGGSVASTRDFGRDLGVDAAGSVYVTGETRSGDFPTTLGAYDTSHAGGEDVFVTKLDPSGTALIYSTYLGGWASDAGYGLALDGQGAVYVVGHTASPDFPTTPGSFMTSPPSTHNVFVTKLDPTGSLLEYATYLGPISLLGTSQSVSFTDIAVDNYGQAYVTGATSSAAFPTTPGAFDTSFNGSRGYGGDAFIAKLNAEGSDLVYSTFLGSSGDEVSEAIAIDAEGNAYVTGRTYSASFPVTPSAFDPTFNSTGSSTDVFVAKLDSDGGNLLWSTFLGGEWSEESHALALNGMGEVHVTGTTASTLFPVTVGAFDEEQDPNDYDGFFAILTPDGGTLAYSTFLGGREFDEVWGLDLDDAGNVYLAGQTYSPDFPTTPGAFDTSFNRYGDAFVTRIAPRGLGSADLAYSTFLGGLASDEGATGIAVDAGGFAHVVGWTFSDDFPTTPGAIKTSHPRFDLDVFVAKLFTGAAGEVCTGGRDDDGDGLSDCADPECCFEQACWGAPGCDSVSAGITWRQAALANATIAGPVTVAVNDASLETAAVTSGSFVGEGFFRGVVELVIEGAPYVGAWKGLLFEKPGDRRLVLRGAFSGGLRGTVEGYLEESQEGSGEYDRYVASWEIVRLGATGTAISLAATADVSTVAKSDEEVALSALQDGMVASSSGDYTGPLPIRMTRVAVASPASPLVGEGFTFFSYDSGTGSGEGWAHLHRTGAGLWELTGSLSDPLPGFVSGVLDERRLPRTLTLTVERASLPPLADVELRPVGPRLPSPGQTVDYAIEYWNRGVLPAEDVVVVAQLPAWAQFVSATAGAMYRWDTHESVWRLGTVGPREGGVVTVRVTYFWELPEGTPLSLLAMYESSSPERDYYLNPGRTPLFDHASYLAAAPLEITSFTALSREAFAAERAADSALDDLYLYALESGHQYLAATAATISDGAALLRVLLANAGSEPVILTRVDGRSFLEQPLPTGMSFFDRTGGMTWDAESDILEQWGAWATPGSLTPAQCVRNCIIKKVPRTVLKYVSQTYKLLFKSWDCFRCVTGKKEDKCVKCVAGLRHVPVVGEAVDISQCFDCCATDPECHRCTEDKRGCGKWSPSFDRLDAVHVWRCNANTGEYEPFVTEINCGYTPRPCCIDGQPAFGLCGRIPQICRDGRCLDPEAADVCGRRSFCEPFDGSICPAKDPNAKAGPAVVAAGQRLDYDLELENVGRGIAYGVYVTDVLDADLDDATLEIGPVLRVADGTEIAPSGEYDASTRTVTWLVGEVGPGESAHTTLGVRVRADAPRGTEIVNYARVYFPSVPEVTPTNPVVSVIPLEDCANGVDDDGDGLVDCDAPACDGVCSEADRCHDGRDNDGDGVTDCLDADCRPCWEDCTNGIDDDGDGLVDCDSPGCDGLCAEAERCQDGRDNDDDGAADCEDDECCGDRQCLTCCQQTDYAKGISQVRFDRKGKTTAAARACVDPGLCASLQAGAPELTVRLSACDPIGVPATRIKANRKRTMFRARSARGEQPAYSLSINCKRGEMRLRIAKAWLTSCATVPCGPGDGACALRSCVHASSGGCWCAEDAFTRKFNRAGRLTHLKLKRTVRCPLPP